MTSIPPPSVTPGSQPRLGLKGLVAEGPGEDLRLRMLDLLRSAIFLTAALPALSLIHPSVAFHLGGLPSFFWRYLGVHLLCLTALVGMWALARSRLGTPRVVSMIDLVGLRLVAWGYSIAIIGTPASVRPEFYAYIPVAFLLMLRAAILPSTPARTMVIGIPAVAAVPVVGWYVQSGSASADSLNTPWLVALQMSLLGVFALLATSVVSKVVFGLEQRVLEALQVGQYVLEGKIGEGGMGVVYRARHAFLRRPTALKLLRSDSSSGHNIVRFEREVQTTSRLAHPNTVAVYDYGRTPDGRFYYAMEYLDGLTLEELVRMDGPQPPNRVIHLLRQVCGALGEAHALGLVHRDIKPANIMVCERGGLADVIKVLDFGLVKEVSPDETSIAQSGVDMVIGTPRYMAPETITAPEEVDARTDLYALGAVIWFLLTGKPLFEGSTLGVVAAHHIYTPVPPISEFSPGPVPDKLEQVLVACLQKAQRDRPATAGEIDSMLAEVSESPWTQASAVRWWEERGHALLARRQVSREGAAHKESKTLAVDLHARSVELTCADQPE